jgi:hypothetical protein
VSKESRRAARAAARAGRTTPASSGPSGTPRAGRRERPRRIENRSFLERYRSGLIGLAAAAIIAVVGGVIFVGATQPAYACSIQWEPQPTASPAAGATQRLGYVQEHMGESHVVSRPQRYTFCPPASGNHFNQQGLGPIEPRVYRPGDNIAPPNWIHNLEHGGLVVLYRTDSEGATDAGRALFQQFFDNLPNSPICDIERGRLSPVIAPFDQMKWPYAALVWDRVLPLDEWDAALVTQFYLTESERLDVNGEFVTPPEPGGGTCQAPSPNPSASGSAAPSAVPSAAPSASPSEPASPAPSVSPAPS